MTWFAECYFCQRKIARTERPVLIKSGRHPEYAHKECVPKMFLPKRVAS